MPHQRRSIFRAPLALLCLLVLPLMLRAQAKQKKLILRPENPMTTASVTVLALPDLPPIQRALVYVRADKFPGILVVVRQGTATAEDLAAGYETAIAMVGPKGAWKEKSKRTGTQVRAVVGPAQLRTLSSSQQAYYARYLEHLARARPFTIEGVGTGPLLRIARRV